MKLTVEITKEHEWVLNSYNLTYSYPYGKEIKHIINQSSNPNNYDFVKLINELSEMGLLHYISMDNGTAVYYELTKIGRMFYNEINK